ncbi:MAG: (2Fe-2S)-binding protein [Phycisphaerales bacterium]|nr:(2Fe-2S)-binding protein [Phycisphaerales bacterium]
MDQDDHVCLCFRVSLRKLNTFLHCERPRVASELSECFGAGTGCHWCVPFLKELHRQWQNGQQCNLDEEKDDYARHRAAYRKRIGDSTKVDE